MREGLVLGHMKPSSVDKPYSPHFSLHSLTVDQLYTSSDKSLFKQADL